YVSLQSALAHYGLIPEYAPVTTSVTTARPGRWETPLGTYTYRHIKPDLLAGYRRTAMGEGQHAYVATPEKALLDLAYLEPGGDARTYLEGLRLQHLDLLDLDALRHLADRAQRPKLARAAARIAEMARIESLAYEAV
ncbi:MAG: hypothetical protein JXA09_11285, partial [Anaerolineae bacterium]|nr:hypothetical protein [Anaerolineae bacterium]